VGEAYGSADLDVQTVNSKLLASSSNVLSSQHGSVGRRLVTIGLDFHATGDTADCFAAGEIGDMDKGVVEAGKDAGDAEDELIWFAMLARHTLSVSLSPFSSFSPSPSISLSFSPVSILLLLPSSARSLVRHGIGNCLPSRAWGPKEMFSWAGRATFLGGILATNDFLEEEWSVCVVVGLRGIVRIVVIICLPHTFFGGLRQVFADCASERRGDTEKWKLRALGSGGGESPKWARVV
jgi:hypothetical protein